jgi:4'-phosphopantetheinyl transferase
MPFIKTISFPEYTAAFWEITETAGELLKLCCLSATDQHLFERFTNDRRRREFLATRILVSILTAGMEKVSYDHSGKPFLAAPDRYISISHSPLLAAVIIADSPCGIDVEACSRKVDNVAFRFLSEEELAWTALSLNPGQVRLICWCAKEAVFKMIRDDGVDFARQIHILPFVPEHGCLIRAEFVADNVTRPVMLRFVIVGNNAAVWCVDNLWL